jgi:hypothetical protein
VEASDDEHSTWLTGDELVRAWNTGNDQPIVNENVAGMVRG